MAWFLREEILLPHAIDETDRRILKALAANGRLSNTDLASEVGLSPSPCWQRVRAMS